MLWAEKLSLFFQIGSVSLLKCISIGDRQWTYEITTNKGVWIVKRTTCSARRKRIEDSLRYQTILFKNGFSCPQPLAISGQAILKIGDSLFYMYRKIMGDVLAEDLERRAYQVGHSVGKLHCLGRRLLRSEKSVCELIRHGGLLGGPAPFPTVWARRISNADVRNLVKPCTLVHGDLHARNILITGEGLVTFVDWELCRVGNLYEDIGSLLALNFQRKVDIKDLNRVFDVIACGYADGSGGSRPSLSVSLEYARDTVEMWRAWVKYTRGKRATISTNSYQPVS